MPPTPGSEVELYSPLYSTPQLCLVCVYSHPLITVFSHDFK